MRLRQERQKDRQTDRQKRARKRETVTVCVFGACLALENSEQVWATWQDPATETKQLTRIISCLEMSFKFVSSI